MKKRVIRTISYFITILFVSSIATSALFFVKLSRSHDKLENTIRLQNQAILEIRDGKIMLACKSLISAKNSLKNADYADEDTLGLVYSSSIEICNKINKN